MQASRSAITLIAIGFIFALAGCGSTSKNGTAAASPGPALAYVKCLRSHGVPNFPDPGPDGRLPNIPSDIDTAAPAFRSAQNRCAELEPGGVPGRSSKGATLALLAAAQCMRKHGFANFPDPTTSPPPPPPPGAPSGNAVGFPGAYVVLPRDSPAATRAEAACGLRLP